MTIDCEKLRKHINKCYEYGVADGDHEEYYTSVKALKSRGFVYNLATFLFDHKNERTYLKRNLPENIYIKVLEALCDGEHDT